MPGYSNADGMRSHLGEALLAQFTADSGAAVDDERLNAVITEASDLIDSYLGARYAVPVTAAKSVRVIAPHCREIAKAILLGRRLGNRFDPQGETNLLHEAFAWLKRIADRKASLPDAAELTAPAGGTAAGMAGSDVLVFGDPQDPNSGGALL